MDPGAGLWCVVGWDHDICVRAAMRRCTDPTVLRVVGNHNRRCVLLGVQFLVCGVCLAGKRHLAGWNEACRSSQTTEILTEGKSSGVVLRQVIHCCRGVERW